MHKPTTEFSAGKPAGSILLHVPVILWLQAIRDILLKGHRQAFVWMDEWIGKHIFPCLYHITSLPKQCIGQLAEYKGSFYVQLHQYMAVSLEAVAVLAACSNHGGFQ